MSDFQAETAQNTMTFTLKILQFFLKALEGVRDTLIKAEKENAEKKEKEIIEDAFKKLNRTVGEVPLDTMEKTGMPVTTMQIKLTPDNMKQVDDLMRQNGVHYAVNLHNASNDGMNTYMLSVFEKDIGNVKNVFNQTAKEAVEALETAAKENGMESTFNQALDHRTNVVLNQSADRYICERDNPDNYIHSLSANDRFKGQDYTKTIYTVYRDNDKKTTYHDGRFDGRPKDYWHNVREQIKRDGNFSDNLLVFENKQAFDGYREQFHENKKQPEQIPEKTQEQPKPEIISDEAREQLRQEQAFVVDTQPKANNQNGIDENNELDAPRDITDNYDYTDFVDDTPSPPSWEEMTKDVDAIMSKWADAPNQAAQVAKEALQATPDVR